MMHFQLHKQLNYVTFPQKFQTMANLNLTLKVWRQENAKDKGSIQTYDASIGIALAS